MTLLNRMRGRLRAATSRPFVKGMSIASEGPSMYPTISSGLSYNVSSRRHKHGRNIQVGDIVVFRSPIFAEQESCKRVIGMPGDYVLRDPSLSPTVGGAPVLGLGEENTHSVREEPVMVQVPEGHVWVAGDNLSWSRDSRFHGPVPMALIQGKTLYTGPSLFNLTSFRKPQLQPAMVADEGSPGPSRENVEPQVLQPS
ncbi:Mitochondrial inner membrane peptidase complex subunit [Cladophialophora chaetospira]|uniref:Mitochondrial inner membrane protease subunit n=1 Tax=Cladophialophora chaetospira TaxID=386627 RepID=A0AA39CDJ6_9EURO|nr:Mitochondrial inner membrane peptidase complex subunit [Cladophialophora chaetospira]